MPIEVFKDIRAIRLFQDFRSNTRGAEFDNIQLTALTRLDADNLENQMLILDMLRKNQELLLRSTVIPSIPFDNLQLWLRADTIVAQNEATLDQWYDASGRGNHVSSTGDKRPQYIASSLIYDRPAVRFTASKKQELRCSARADFNFTEATIFVVATPGTGCPVAIAQKETDADHEFLLLGSSSFPWIYHHTTGGVSHCMGHQTPVTQPCIQTAVFGKAPADLKLYLNGVASTKSLSSSNGDRVQDFPSVFRYVVIGNRRQMTTTTLTESFDGDIAEILVYAGKLGDQERAIVENYLGMKYGIPRN